MRKQVVQKRKCFLRLFVCRPLTAGPPADMQPFTRPLGRIPFTPDYQYELLIYPQLYTTIPLRSFQRP